MRTLLFIVLITSLIVLLAGCGTTSGYGKPVNPPAGWLMESPAHFPNMKPGDDARMKLVQAAGVHNKTRRQVKGLQRYVRTVRGQTLK